MSIDELNEIVRDDAAKIKSGEIVGEQAQLSASLCRSMIKLFEVNLGWQRMLPGDEGKAARKQQRETRVTSRLKDMRRMLREAFD